MKGQSHAAEMQEMIREFIGWYEKADPKGLDFGRELEQSGFVERFTDALTLKVLPADPHESLREAVRRERRLKLAGEIVAASNPLGSNGAITPRVKTVVESAFHLADYILAYHDDPHTDVPAPAGGWPRVARVPLGSLHAVERPDGAA